MPDLVESLRYCGNICISGLTAAGKTTHSHLLAGEFGLTYVSGSQIQLNFLGLSPIQSRTHLINILGSFFCETGVAQGVSADLYGGPLGTDRRTVGSG
ncbi:MAG: hypothetical protein ABSE27_02195, partial [Acidobacteriaceae bacterium]